MSDLYLDPTAAAAWLTERLGRVVTYGSLSKAAYTGRGPRYATILGRVSYLEADLQAWLEGQTPRTNRRRAGQEQAA